MQKPEDWDDTTPIQNRRPKEGYFILKIINATEGQSKNTQEPLIRFEFDILEGDFSGYFTALSQKLDRNLLLQYNQLTNNKKSLPYFKRMILDIEASNYGYKFDFTTHSLRGKKVGAYLATHRYESVKGPREILKVDRIFPVAEVREMLGRETTERLTSGTENINDRYQAGEYTPKDDDLPW